MYNDEFYSYLKEIGIADSRRIKLGVAISSLHEALAYMDRSNRAAFWREVENYDNGMEGMLKTYARNSPGLTTMVGHPSRDDSDH